MKILFYATHPSQPIGYGKIGHHLSNYLASKPDIELYYFGVSNFPNNVINRLIDPRIKIIDAWQEECKMGNNGEYYGVNVIERFIQTIQPDLVFIYNDIIVVSRIFNALIDYRKSPLNKQFKVITYLDLVYKYERLDLIKHVDYWSDFILVFTNHWKQHLIDLGINPAKIDTLEHGLCTDLVYPVDRKTARAQLGLHKDDFIVLNTNRNSYRKALDLTIRAFLLFLRAADHDPKIKLFLNCFLKSESGYNILLIIEIECKRLGLDYDEIIQNHILIHPNNTGFVSDEIVNYMYNACDVGINTCIGEGFGLCNMEHAALGTPQIVSKVGGLIDVFKGGGATLIQPKVSLQCSNHIDGHNGDFEICDALDFSDALMIYYTIPSLRIEHGIQGREYILKTFCWDKICNKLYTLIKSVLL